MRLPFALAYPGAATVEDANGDTVAECPDHETAAALVDAVNAIRVWSFAQAPGRGDGAEQYLFAALERLEGHEL